MWLSIFESRQVAFAARKKMNSKLFNRLLHPVYYNFIFDTLFAILDLSLVLIDVFFYSQGVFTFQSIF